MYKGFIIIASTAVQVGGGTTGGKIQPAPHHSSILLVLGGLPIPFRQRVLLAYGPPRRLGPGRNSSSLCVKYPNPTLFINHHPLRKPQPPKNDGDACESLSFDKCFLANHRCVTDENFASTVETHKVNVKSFR